MKQKYFVIGGILALIALIFYGRSQTMAVSDLGSLWTGLGSTGQYFILGLIIVLVVVGFFYSDKKVK